MLEQTGTALIEAGIINPEQLSRALDHQRRALGRLASACLDLGFADESTLARVLSRQMGFPFVVLAKSAIPLELLELFSQEAARKFSVLPIRRLGNELIIAMADPYDTQRVDEIRFLSGANVVEHGALFGPLHRAIESAYSQREKSAAGLFKGNQLDPGLDLGTAGHAAIVSGREGPAEPAAEPVETAPVPEAQSGLPDTEISPAQLAVLVVDDDDSLRQMLVEFLKKSGYHAWEAADGREAVLKLQAGLPDAILLDAMLPGVHGFDICSRIKNAQSTRHIPVIMISAEYRGGEHKDNVRLFYGANAYIEKPLKLSELRRVLENCLSVRDPRPDFRTLFGKVQAALHQASQAIELERFDEAAQRLQEALAITPFYPTIHTRLAFVYRKLGENYRAIAQLEKAAELDPEFRTLFHLAGLYQKTGFTSKARNTWNRCLQACDNPKDAERIRQQLSRIDT